MTEGKCKLENEWTLPKMKVIALNEENINFEKRKARLLLAN